MKIIYTNTTTEQVVVYDKYSKRIEVEPGETVTYYTEDAYSSFSELNLVNDDVNGDGSLVYTGYSHPDTDQDEAGWIIRKSTVAAGVTTVLWAGGSSHDFIHKWCHRTISHYR